MGECRQISGRLDRLLTNRSHSRGEWFRWIDYADDVIGADKLITTDAVGAGKQIMQLVRSVSQILKGKTDGFLLTDSDPNKRGVLSCMIQNH